MALSSASSQTGLVGISPVARQFEIAYKLSDNRWSKWVRPGSPVGGSSIDVSEITSVQYWSLENGRLQDRPVWSFFIAKQTASGEEKYYVFYDPDSNGVYLEKDTGDSSRRCYEAMLQPAGGVYLQVLEGDKFLYANLDDAGNGILQTSALPMLWSIKKSHVTGTEGEKVVNVPAEIIVPGGSERWITSDLLDYSQISVGDHTEEQKWLIRTGESENTIHEIVADGMQLQVRNGDGNSVRVETERLSKELQDWTYTLSSDNRRYGSILIGTTETPPTYLSKSGTSNTCDEEDGSRMDYILRVNDPGLSDTWIMDVTNFPFVIDDIVNYFPPLKDDKNAGCGS